MSNPVLNENTFIGENYSQNYVVEGTMTKNGVIMKSFLLLTIVVIAAAFSWLKAISAPEIANIMIVIGLIGGLITGLIIPFKPHISPYLAPVYAIFEGLVLGVFSAFFEAQFPGIVYQAVLGTFAVFFTVLALYASRIIVVTNKVRGVILSATIAVFFVYLVAIILSLFHINVPYLYDANAIGIGISVVITVIAASNFLLDFDIIERGLAAYAPKYMEWYCSYGMLVTLVWVYIEILKLLAKLSRRR